MTHIPRTIHIPRGQLELNVNDLLADPTLRIVVYCEFGKISTLAAAPLKEIGFSRTVALDLGVRHWLEKGYPVEKTVEHKTHINKARQAKRIKPLT